MKRIQEDNTSYKEVHNVQENKGADMTISAPRETRVLSIQSWVCHGYVGNKCSLLSLQMLGIDVDPINTVQFSNHTGYPTWKGQVLSGDQLLEIFQGLEENRLCHYTHLLTGYVNSTKTLRSIMKVHDALKSQNPNIIYACDPVLGDAGKLYVSSELVDLYRIEVLPRATFLFPNQTECEVLCGLKIRSEKDALRAIDMLHNFGIRNVIITSLYYESDQTIVIIGSSLKETASVPFTSRRIDSNVTSSSKLEQNTDKTSLEHSDSTAYCRFKMEIPKLPEEFSGTGDLFAALVTGWTAQGDDLKTSCERTVNSIQAVLMRTVQESTKMEKELRFRELSLVRSRFELFQPKIQWRASPL